MIKEPSAPKELQQPIPWISYTILAGSIYVFGADLVLTQGRLAEHLLLVGPLVQQGEWWRTFSWVFVHGGPIHILFNMMAVVTLGRTIERSIGSYRFFIATVVGTMGSAIAVLVWNFEQPTVGASGVILAWAGAILPVATQTGRRQLGIWLAQVAIISLLPQVSGAGHVGGFLFGLPCGLLMRQDRKLFSTLAPVLVFVSAVLLFIASTGRLHR